jgi:hypothetical protein
VVRGVPTRILSLSNAPLARSARRPQGRELAPGIIYYRI